MGEVPELAGGQASSDAADRWRNHVDGLCGRFGVTESMARSTIQMLIASMVAVTLHMVDPIAAALDHATYWVAITVVILGEGSIGGNLKKGLPSGPWPGLQSAWHFRTSPSGSARYQSLSTGGSGPAQP